MYVRTTNRKTDVCCPDAFKLVIPPPKREVDSDVFSVYMDDANIGKDHAQANAHVHADKVPDHAGGVHDHAGEEKIILKPMLMFMFMQEKITWWTC